MTMNRYAKDFFFGFIAAAFIIVVATTNLNPEVGMAIKQPLNVPTPHITLLSPHNGVTVYDDTPSFSYEVNSVDYDSHCWVLLNDVPQEPAQKVTPARPGRFSTALEPGNYDWRVECELRNGRTISSVPRAVTVKGTADMTIRATGHVIKHDFQPSVTNGGFLFVLIGIIGIVYGAHLYRHKD